MRRRCRLAAALALLAGGFAAWLLASVPDVRPLASGAPPATAYMRMRASGRGLAPGAVAPAPAVPLDGMSPLLVCAIVKAEDRTFFRHGGVLWDQLPGLAADALRGRGARGGSSITQQLARNLYLSPGRTPRRKLREALIARRLETELSKRRILELYLNVIELGDGVWGVRAASRAYLGAEAAEADAFEAAFLASLVAAPGHPLSGANAGRARGVQRRVLRQLRVSGLVTEREMRSAMARSDTLFAVLATGRDLAGALGRARALPSPPPPRDPLTVPRVLANECGLAGEIGPGALNGARGEP